MNHTAGFASILEQDADLQLLQERHGSISARILEATDALRSLEGKIELARTADNVRAMADAIVSGQDIEPKNAPSLAELRDEYDRQDGILKAHRLAAQKIESKIKERVTALARDFLRKQAGTLKARVSAILDGLLTIAEANAEDARMRNELKKAGFPPEIFKGVARPLSGWVAGHGPTDIDVLRSFIAANTGFEPTTQQSERITTLERNAT
jgi:uncharacterized phage infection (PIP) family protein YhgE